jgi:S1 RNA binding domain protein
MVPEVGAVVAGVITGITKFGAFVDLEEGKTGLVHISQISSDYVDDVSEHLAVGDEVKVRVLNVDEKGRISLSIKQAEEPEPEKPEPRRSAPAPRLRAEDRVIKPAANSFEDKLKRFMKDSDSKISGLYSDRRTSRKRGK